MVIGDFNTVYDKELDTRTEQKEKKESDTTERLAIR